VYVLGEIRKLMASSEPPRRKIGFMVKGKAVAYKTKRSG
jgi:hypothetical protein